MEANSLAFVMEQEMRTIGCTVIILNASQLSVIYASTKKTDKEDAVKHARLIKIYEKEDLPTVDVPTDKEWYRRKLIKEYKTLKADRTREINRLHALFVQCGITTIKRSNVQTDVNRQEVLPQLFDYEARQAKRVCARLTVLDAQIEELDQLIKKECKEDEDIQRLQTIPGVGDGKRFNNGDQVSNYLGIVPRVDCSGTINKYGHITKKGNGVVRSLLYQAAWAIVRSKRGGALKAKYFYMTEHGKGKKISITAIARKMAKLLYVVMKNKQMVYQEMPAPSLRAG
ncbi:IS110 family transposase [Treponema vincentii]|uniref:IS110 family transposase n=1 Tax=Treponema vincentii TaxID=69710 RepID=UPI0020A47EBC